MKRLLEFHLEDILPEGGAVLEHQGMPHNATVPEHIQSLLEEAQDEFASEARPTGIMQELTVEEFDDVFEGEGRNDPESPLAAIYPHAEALALFAITMGEMVSMNIESMFKGKNFALGAMLDAIASLAADEAAAYAEEQFQKEMIDRNGREREIRVLGYSPGYCGWHISAQKKLFAALEPERIGIKLNTSYLMTPLKSVSGVLVAGRPEIHIFKPSFNFCKTCMTFSCQPRLKSLKAVST